MRLQLLRVSALLAGLALVPACDSSKPEAAPAAAPAEAPKVAAAEPAKTEAKTEVKADAAHEGEEGCVYAGAGQNDCPSHEGPGAASTGEPGHYGAAFALKDARPLGQVLASGKDALPKDAVQVSGVVENVCQKKGCWLVVKDGEAQARILMKDHAFTVPMDTKGKPVVVEGTLEARTFNEAQVKHLEKDGGGDPAKIAGERTEYVLTATGVKIAANS